MWRRAAVNNGIDRSDERQSRNQHFTASIHVDGQQSRMQRRRSVYNRDRVTRASILGELLLEAIHEPSDGRNPAGFDALAEIFDLLPRKDRLMQRSRQWARDLANRRNNLIGKQTH